jgi:hypothetical protein
MHVDTLIFSDIAYSCAHQLGWRSELPHYRRSLIASEASILSRRAEGLNKQSQTFRRKEKIKAGSTIYLSYLRYLLLNTSHNVQISRTNGTLCICAKKKKEISVFKFAFWVLQ